MELRNVETFVTIVEKNNFTRAAEKLGYAQSTVTDQIKQLEEELGAPLFDRMGRKIKLTSAGESFLPYALALLDARDKASTSVRSNQEPVGDLKIGVVSSLASMLISDCVREFSDLYPQVHILVVVSDVSDDLHEKLCEGNIDFFIYNEESVNFAKCEKVIEWPCELVVVTHPNNQRTFSNDDEMWDFLCEETRFIYSADDHYYKHFVRLGRQNNREFSPQIEIASLHGIAKMLKAGTGAYFFPKFIVEDELTKGELVALDIKFPEIQLFTQMFRNKDRWENPQMRAFREFIQEKLEEYSG